jgi:hypothetical protein
MEIQANRTKQKFNRWPYALFLLAGVGFAFYGDFSQAAIFTSLALIFDPFDEAIPFKQRKSWQKSWLYLHVLLSIAMFAAMLLLN